jgi:hypothetical protein
MSEPHGVALFEEKQVRRTWDEQAEKWYFSVVDVVSVLMESDYQTARKYWKVLKGRLFSEGFEVVTNCYQLKMTAPDGKQRLTDVADAEQLLRIIQSIPSPKAEPFKQWLARVGYERLREIENPELATDRIRETYQRKGYSEEWISQRMRGIAIRDELTEEWKKRGVREQREYSILTAEISKATFGMTPSEYKQFKGLKRENLRDHMTDLETIFTMLGEASTKEIAIQKDAVGFVENQDAAQRGGKIAGDARKQLEVQSGKKVSTRDNYKRLSAHRKADELHGQQQDSEE